MQHCRFHFAYYPDGYDRDWSDIEPDEMDSETGEYPIHRDWDEIESCYTFEYETYSETPPIELRKAEAVFKESRWMPMCEGCEETFTAASQGKKSAGVADVTCGLTSWARAGCAFHASSLRRPRHTKMISGRLERMGNRFDSLA